MKRSRIRIGSRGSELALWQARWVQKELLRLYPGTEVGIDVIRTTGDRILDSPLSKIGDRGLFTRDIEIALADGTIDLAVHSLKDLPTGLPEGLEIGAVCERADVRDVFIPRPGNSRPTLLDQPHGARIATGSLRRKCQLLNLRPDFEIVELRGNLNTRLKKLDASDWSGMILAMAGVTRLGWNDRIGESLSPLTILPAVGQGALAVEIRSDDQEIRTAVAPLDHLPTRQAVWSERALLRRLEGGCQVPIGTYGRLEGTRGGNPELRLDAVVGSLDGRTVVRGSIRGAPEEGESLGKELAEKLLAEGAETILQEIRAAIVSGAAGRTGA